MNKKYETIRRITITGNNNFKFTSAYDYLERNGYRFISLHPKSLARGRKDFSRFGMVGEKEVGVDEAK